MNNKICAIITALYLLTISGVAWSVATPTDPKAKDVSGRIPASVAAPYQKEVEGVFEAQGFGEDFPEPSKLRAPAQEETTKDDASQKTEPEITTVKMEDELEKELQLQRRVDVFYEGRVRFKNGAAIWATEDPGTVSPKLEIAGPNEMDINAESIRFRVFTNYLPFIKNWELRIFKREKLKSEVEVATLKGGADELFDIEYKIKPGTYKEGDALFYQLKVIDEKGSFDLVSVKRIAFINRPQGLNLTESDELTEAEQLAQIWGASSLEIQNIPILGSRVRLVGNNVPLNYVISYRGQNIAADSYGKFVVEEHYPVGKHQLNLQIQDNVDNASFTVPFNIDISGKYFFMVGIADMRIGESKLSEKITGLVVTDEYDGNVFVDGRLAYFLKGKIKGKYLITSQLDTTEGPIDEIFKGFHRKNSEALFRRLDPDRYYPVYGDNSTTTEEAPTLGKFYVKIETDQSYALWGNSNTEMSSTLISQYNRTLYGGHVSYKSRSQTKYGDRKTEVRSFVAEPETLLGHNEFLGTGGRLYILRHNDVVQGSEKLVIEIRDRDSGLLKEQIELKPFQDYEFDYLAGRIVLTQPLTTFVNQNADEIIDPNGIGNNRYYLVADYEYSDTGEGLDNLTYGGKVNKWIGDHVSVGGTYVNEKRGNEEYSLQGVDTKFRFGQESFVQVETSRTESQQTESNFLSNDGGLSFTQKSFVTAGSERSANAWALESQLFLNDFLETKHEGVLATWYRDFEAGFSTARRQASNDIQEYGYDFEFNLNNRDVFKSKLAISEEEQGIDRQSFIASYGRRLKRASSVSTEYRLDRIEAPSSPVQNGHLLGLKYSKTLSPSLSAYLKGQTTVKKEGGYESNDRVALGGRFNFSQKWDGNAEYSVGDRGDAAVAGLGYNMTQSYRVYANLDRSADTATGPVSNGLTIGQRKNFRNGVRLTAENQFEETAEQAGFNQLYGLDYNLNRLMALSFTYQMGDLLNENTGATTSKNAAGVGITYTKDADINLSSKLSYVKDRGEVNLDQILITNSLKFRVGPSQSWFFEADYSLSEDPTNTVEALARYIEGNIGYAFRPVMNDRWNIFARYTYLYDLDSQAQENARNDQRVHIASIEGTYDLTRKWGLGLRLAQKIGSERINRDQGPWIDTTLSFAQLRARYHLIKKWDGLFELRAVSVEESQDLQAGALIGLDYHLGRNFKLGLGFNFTRFNDDLTNFSFDNYGWFINVVGKM